MATSILLPPSTRVFVAGFTNAAFRQRITINPPSGPSIVWEGTGENNHHIGDEMMTTPGGGNQTYTVKMEYSSDGGANWQPSSMIPGGCVIGSYNVKVVLSEDHVDQDFNDSVVQFTWWEPL